MSINQELNKLLKITIEENDIIFVASCDTKLKISQFRLIIKGNENIFVLEFKKQIKNKKQKRPIR